MKNKKDIFDLFRDNEHKLDERPDGKLWDRLEGRLDQSLEPHRAPSRNGWRQWMSMAGVMLALIVVISLINIMFRGENGSKQSAENVGVMQSLEMEEIGIFSDKGPNYTVGEYQKMLARLNTSPILEGDASKKIRIQESVFASLNERSKRQIASVDKILKAEEKVAASKLETKKAEPKVIASDEVVLAEAYVTDFESTEDTKSEIDAATTDFASSEFEDEAGVVMMDAEVVAEADQVVTTSTSTSAPVTAKMEEANFSEPPSDLNAATNAISVTSVDVAGVQQFNWLLGKWEASSSGDYASNESAGAAAKSSAKKRKSRSAKEAAKDMAKNKAKGNMTASTRSVEEWKPLDEFTIAGQGYLVVNGDTTFTENMQIKKIGTDLYYILALDNSGQQVQYKLKTYTEEGAVFENESVAFPNQVILQRDFSNSNFTTVLQNKTPVQINTEQQEYLMNRNMIRSEQVKRVMNRVEN